MKYRFSFTAVGLAPVAMQEVAALYPVCGTWEAVYAHIVKENTLKCRTVSALRRIATEIVLRLGKLAPEELARFIENRLNERNVFAWLAACRAYDLVGDFAVESLHEAYVTGQKTYETSDYEKFVNGKLALHPEFDELSRQTYAKVRQIVFKMMREAGFLDKKGTIIPLVMDAALMNFIPERDLAFFPMYIGGR